MKIRLILLVLLTVFSCKDQPEFKNKQVTVIISNPLRIQTNIGTGIDINTLTRLDENINSIKDTVQVFSDRYRKVYLRNADTFKSIICETGDTVYLDITESDIIVNFKNKTLKKYDTLPIAILYDKQLKDEISKANHIRSKIFIEDEWTKEISIDSNFINANENTFLEYVSIQKEIAEKSNKILMNMLQSDSISSQYYHYYKSQNNYTEFSKLLDAYNLTGDTYLKNQVFQYYKSENIANDNFIAYGYYNRLVKDVYIMKYKYDYKETFDSLALDLSGISLKYAQLICLKEIALNYDYKTYKLHEEKYLNGVNGSMELIKTIKKIGEDFALKPNFFVEEDFTSVEFKTTKGKKISLDGILKTYPNKIIYIDFWASWCVPCRASMPASKKLSKDYADRDVVFIYVSIDKDVQEWNVVSKKEGLGNSIKNLLAINYPSAKVYEKLNLKSIPRYLLFNKKGELELRDAPGPDSKKIRESINRLLNQ